MPSDFYILLLILLPLTVAHSYRGHKLSSTVHPCDDFREFVCNTREYSETELKFLSQELYGHFQKALSVALLKDNDPVLAVFNKIFDDADNETLSSIKKEYVYGHHIDDQRLTVMMMSDIQRYLNLLYIKYIDEYDLNPKSVKDQYEQLFGDMKGEVIRVIQNNSWIPESTKTEYIKEVQMRKVFLGLPDHLTMDFVVKVISNVHEMFFDRNDTMPIGCNPKCQIKYYVDILREATQNPTVNEDGVDALRFPAHEFGIFEPDISSYMIIEEEDLEQPKFAKAEYYSPAMVHLYDAMEVMAVSYVTTLLNALLKLEKVDSFKELSIYENAPLKCYEKYFISTYDFLYLEALQLVTHAMSSNGTNGGVQQFFSDVNFRSPSENGTAVLHDLSDVQRLFIRNELLSCPFEITPKTLLMLNDDFQRDQMPSDFYILLLILLPLIVAHSYRGHKLSSTAHPCDDFREFVCNTKEHSDPELNLLSRRLHGQFHKAFSVALLKDNDPVLAVFNKEYVYDRNFDQRAPVMQMVDIQRYLNLLYIKCIHEYDLNPKSVKDQYEQLFGDMKGEVIRVIQNSSWIPESAKAEFIKEVQKRKVFLGLPDHLTKDFVVKVISNVHEMFFDRNDTMPIGCNHMCQIKYYVDVLREATQNATVNEDGVDALRFPAHEFGVFEPDISSYMIIGEEDLEQPKFAKTEYYSPAMIHPYDEYAVTDIAVNFLTTLLNAGREKVEFFKELSIYENAPLKCYEKHSISAQYVGHIEALRLVTHAMSSNGTNGGVQQFFSDVNFRSPSENGTAVLHDLSDVQRLFIRNELLSCPFEITPKTLLILNDDFQREFGCKPGHSYYRSKEDICHFFV
ncbi:hypothetical protein QR680_014529 [Steinernema hermaphroditum]|uniref:Peptidase M13 N-terminal domain-containing protein n=1 Tax=Steinernema hermaphroditum TaxID=289476 RepID=A0AA39M4D5_9BILA|nr:hypothetical protein QR680_014529 [Steinernema hermaphroditum]